MIPGMTSPFSLGTMAVSVSASPYRYWHDFGGSQAVSGADGRTRSPHSSTCSVSSHAAEETHPAADAESWGVCRVVLLRLFGPAATLVRGLRAKARPDRVEPAPALARQLARAARILGHHEATRVRRIVACVNLGVSGRGFNCVPDSINRLQREQACSRLG